MKHEEEELSGETGSLAVVRKDVPGMSSQVPGATGTHDTGCGEVGGREKVLSRDGAQKGNPSGKGTGEERQHRQQQMSREPNKDATDKMAPTPGVCGWPLFPLQYPSSSRYAGYIMEHSPCPHHGLSAKLPPPHAPPHQNLPVTRPSTIC